MHLKQLAEDFSKYLYLPRLRDEDVLLGTVRNGLERLTWESETFAYSEGWDEARGRYKGLRIGQTRVIIDNDTVLVKPDIAATQMQTEREAQGSATTTQTPTTPSSGPAHARRPQEIINKQVLRNCDLLIAVFWTRLGTPTGGSTSGTVEEIREHIATGKPAMIYLGIRARALPISRCSTFAASE